jgi:uncharacterized protein involved in outer membrane biogenesis
MKRMLLIGGAAIVFVVVVAVVLLIGNIDSLIKTAVEEVGSEATKAKVTLDDVEISTDGKGALRGLTVGNPQGFKTDNAFKLGEVSISLDIASVTKDTVTIKNILIAGPEVTYEWASGGSNLDAIKKNVETFVGMGSGGSAPSGKAGFKGEAKDDGGKKLVIDKLTISGGKVNVSASFLAGKKMSVPLPTIEMKDIGKDKGGASAGKAVTSLNIGKLTDSVKGLVGGAGSMLQKGTGGVTETVGKATESTGKAVEGAAGALKKLFGK